MKRVFVSLLTLAIIGVGCNEVVEEKEVVVEQEITTEEEEHHHDNEEIVLNNGEKWKVVDEMLAYIRNMETAVDDFENDSEKDYSALAQTIDKNIRELTSNCTMEGQAHDELHKWLVPFIGLSEEFDVATELDEQERIYQEFKVSFEAFNTYFE